MNGILGCCTPQQEQAAYILKSCCNPKCFVPNTAKSSSPDQNYSRHAILRGCACTFHSKCLCLQSLDLADNSKPERVHIATLAFVHEQCSSMWQHYWGDLTRFFFTTGPDPVGSWYFLVYVFEGHYACLVVIQNSRNLPTDCVWNDGKHFGMKSSQVFAFWPQMSWPLHFALR